MRKGFTERILQHLHIFISCKVFGICVRLKWVVSQQGEGLQWGCKLCGWRWRRDCPDWTWERTRKTCKTTKWTTLRSIGDSRKSSSGLKLKSKRFLGIYQIRFCVRLYRSTIQKVFLPMIEIEFHNVESSKNAIISNFLMIGQNVKRHELKCTFAN